MPDLRRARVGLRKATERAFVKGFHSARVGLHWLGRPVARILLEVERHLGRGSPTSSWGPVRIVDYEAEGRGSPFIEVTREALALLERDAPSRWARVRREIRRVVHVPRLRALGLYLRAGRDCRIDFRSLESMAEGDRAWLLVRYASLLVHEATHGWLLRRGIHRFGEGRIRVERVCHGQERRVAVKLADNRVGDRRVVGPFDEARWQEYFRQSSWSRLREGIGEALE